MKNIINSLAVVSAIVLAAGCSSPKDNLSSSTVVKLANEKLAEMARDNLFVTVQTGTYECNNDTSRENLRAMEAAGLLTYNVERYAWWEKYKKNVKKTYTVKRQGFWGTYDDTETKWVKTDSYDFCDHYVVTVALTGKGRKLEVASLPQPADDEDPDLLQPKVDVSKYAWNKQDISESWPEIPNPFIDAPRSEAKSSSKTNETTSKTASESKPDDYAVRIDSLQHAAYQAVDFSSKDHHLKVGKIKAIKARNIVIHNELMPVAEAEIILHAENVTDPGRIYLGIENDERSLCRAKLIYYCDKGWTITSMEVD